MSSIGPVELAILCLIVLFLAALLVAAVFAFRLLSKRPDVEAGSDPRRRVPCPYCAELILPEAKVCRYCGRDLEPRSGQPEAGREQ